MNSRERLTAAARGGEVDRKPVIVSPGWSGTAPEADAVVVEADVETVARSVGGEQVVLAQVDNPFARYGPALNAEFGADPVAAAQKLDRATDDVRRKIGEALGAGADGILYRLFGARARHSTPMQYGGHYLERDRELLEEIADARLNVLFLVGNDDLYLDFICDLPAQVIAWDREASGFSSASVRAARTGAQASSDPESEILLYHPGVRIADQLDRF
ncbi:MAG: hypothetical protein ACO1SV_11820 [Fimbriimonas sp.]